MIFCILSAGSPHLAAARELDPAVAQCVAVEPAVDEPAAAIPISLGATASDQVLLGADLVAGILPGLITACRSGALGAVRILATDSLPSFQDIGFRARPWLRGIHRLAGGDVGPSVAPGALPAPLSTVDDLPRLLEAWGPPPIRFDEIPCRFPPKLQIQTTTDCHQGCSYCPKGDLPQEGGRMTAALFTSIVEQCAAGRPDGVELYLHAEPVTDERLEQCATEVKDACPDTLVSVVTHELSLDADRAARLGDSGLDVVFTSVNVVGGADAAAIEGRLDRIAELRDILGRGATRLSVVTLANLMDPETLAVFDAACRARSLSLERFKATTRIGEVATERVSATAIHVGPACERPFTKSYIRYNGDMVLCCEDWRYTSVLGNVERETIEEVWTGQAYRALRRAHLDGHPIEPCVLCDYLEGVSA